MQTKIRLLLQEQSDQGLHCLPLCLHHLEEHLPCKTKLLNFLGNYSNYFSCPYFQDFCIISLLQQQKVKCVLEKNFPPKINHSLSNNLTACKQRFHREARNLLLELLQSTLDIWKTNISKYLISKSTFTGFIQK